MRTKTVLRYYCDHCSKGGFRKPDMLVHEMTCCKNPNRGCFLCHLESGIVDFPDLAKQLRARSDIRGVGETEFFVTDSTEVISWLYSKVDGCPACVLAVLCQAKVQSSTFIYKDEKMSWYRELRP